MATRKEVSKIKADFIQQKEAEIKRKVTLQEQKLYERLIDLYMKNRPDASAKSLLSSVAAFEKEIRSFTIENNPSVYRSYLEGSKQLSSLSQQYFNTMIEDPEKLLKIKEQTDKVINKKFGVNDDGTLKKDGFIQKAIQDKSIQKQIIKEVRKAITNNADLETVKETFRKIIVGTPETMGILQRHYNTMAKDILARIDNGNNKIYADELELQHAYYAGGLIKSSRALCIKNNGKIFTRDQIEKLRDDPFIKDMYGDKINDYDPFEQPGGYGCLHSWDWITADLAEGIMREQNKKASLRNKAFKNRNNL